MTTADRIWIGFGSAALSTAALGGLAAWAGAKQGPAWAIAAVLAAAALVAALGAWTAAGSRRTLAVVSREASRVRDAVSKGHYDARLDGHLLPPEFDAALSAMNGTLDRLGEGLAAMTEVVSQLGRGEVPAVAADRRTAELPAAREAMSAAASAVGRLLEDLRTLSASARDEHAELPLPKDRHAGRFLEAVKEVRGSLAAARERAALYERILDALPFPVFAADRDMRFSYVNPLVESYARATRQELLGKPCQALGAPNCGTRECALRQLEAGSGRITVQNGPLTFRVESAMLQAKGERIGHVETTLDVTAMARLSQYQQQQLGKLSGCLSKLAAGEMAIEADVDEGDAHTREAREQFLGTAEALTRVRDAVAAMVRDTGALADAAAAGRLSERANPQAHEGQYRAVIEGLNKTLDAAVAPIREATEILDGLSRRDLRARMSGSYAGDHARIKQSVNATAEALHDAMSHVADAVEQVSSAASQIASSSQAVASGASEQAASLVETSTSTESVATMTRQSADNAQQANHLAEAARAAAGEGTSAVEQMQSAMSRIKASAEGTSQIIRDINDIAFQTNLLALNAAVEAARAGEAGRGFAVVAEEVRSLALRSKEAATKTEELIRQSVKEAVGGEVTAKQVAGKLSDIVGGISKVNDIIAEIAAGAKEQANGIERVNRAVVEMDKVTQQNAASAEESSSAASELSGQAEELASMIGTFRLQRATHPARPASLPAAAAHRAPAPLGAPAPAQRSARVFPAAPPRGRDPERERVFPMEDPEGVKDF